MTAPKVLVQVVSYNSSRWIEHCVESVLHQEGFIPGESLFLLLTDNGSSDGTAEAICRFEERPGVAVDLLEENLGFAAGHNRGAARFLTGDYAAFLIVNPDLGLKEDALLKMSRFLMNTADADAVCPLLLRANQDLTPVEPSIVDSGGIIFEPNLRHFDRGAGCSPAKRYAVPERVFGASGACILFSRDFIERTLLSGGTYEEDLFRVYPQLREGGGERAPFFDEAFFAYREDAELAWRAQRLKLHYYLVPEALGFHVRRVTPERRGELPKEINRLGVRNRFLLQFTHLRFKEVGLQVYVLGWIRNLIVIAAVLIREQSSFSGLREALILRKRARERGEVIRSSSSYDGTDLKHWFKGEKER